MDFFILLKRTNPRTRGPYSVYIFSTYSQLLRTIPTSLNLASLHSAVLGADPKVKALQATELVPLWSLTAGHALMECSSAMLVAASMTSGAIGQSELSCKGCDGVVA